MLAESKMFTLLAMLAAGASVVSAHGHVKSWTVNGVAMPGFNPSNAAAYGATAERPSDNSDQGFVPDITAPRVACGGTSAGSGLETWPVDAGSNVVATWDTWPESHKGPVIEYMAACPASGCDGVDAASLSWFKISEATNDGTTWASEQITTSLSWQFTIPSSIPSGPYLVRHEIIAMHSRGEPQVYPYCFQADVSGGSGSAPAGISIIDAYNINPDFKTWDLYNGQDQSGFKAPGSAVIGGGGSQGGGGPAPVPSSAPAGSSSAAATSGAASQTSDAAPTSAQGGDNTGGAGSPAPSDTGAPAPSETYAPPFENTDAAPAPSSAASSAAAPAPSSPASSAAAPAPSQGGSTGGATDYNTCMTNMNKCKDAANALPNAQAALAACDAQGAQCRRKRDVMNRYGARSLAFF